jgi:hypothetical protein
MRNDGLVVSEPRQPQAQYSQAAWWTLRIYGTISPGTLCFVCDINSLAFTLNPITCLKSSTIQYKCILQVPA